MKPADAAKEATPSRAMEIVNIYHKQSLELINLTLTHNKIAIGNSQQKTKELLRLKETESIQELVSTHVYNQFQNFFLLGNSALQLGLNSHTEIATIFQKQIDDNASLLHDALKSNALSGNPFSTIALTALKDALNTSHGAISSAKKASAKTVEIATRSFAAK